MCLSEITDGDTEFMSYKIKIPYKNLPVSIIFIMLILVCFEGLLGFSKVVVYSVDLLNFVLIGLMILDKKILRVFDNIIAKTHILVLSIGIVTAVCYLESPALILWAIRNLFRYYIFFGACCIYLKEKDMLDAYMFFRSVYYLNFIVFVIQYAAGFRGDFLGGIFGVIQGANAFCNIFLVIVCTYDVVAWFQKKENIWLMIFNIGIAFLISAMSELKFFFIEIVIIIFLAYAIVCIIDRDYKTFLKGILFAIVVLIGLVICINLLGKMYPTFANFFTVKSILKYVSNKEGYSLAGDLNRLSAIETINTRLFRNSTALKIFGKGLGAAEYSGAFKFMTSQFFRSYEDLHYQWMSHSWMYIECGYVGLIGYVLGFVALGISGIVYVFIQKKRNENTVYAISAVILSVIAVLLCVYNVSLRMDCAYLIYFCFAAVYIGRPKTKGVRKKRRVRYNRSKR